MLCSGCASRELKATGGKKVPGGPSKKPQDQQGGFDFWDGDLAPREDIHPLHQPLPNSVWEKFAAHRELLGKPKIMRSDHLDELSKTGTGGNTEPYQHPQEPQEEPRQTRLRLWRRKRGSKTAGLEEMQTGKPLADHLFHHHDVPGAIATIKGGNHDAHAELHASGQADHEHGPKGEVVPKSTHAELPHPEGEIGLKAHMAEHHGNVVQPHELADLGHDDLLDIHDQFHHNSAYSGPDKANHSHPEGGPSQSSGMSFPAAKDMKGKSIVEHLKDAHSLPLSDITKAFKSGGDKPHDGGVGAAQDWHDKAHAEGAPHSHGHTHEEWVKPDTLPHPAKYTNSSMHSHLLTDHGISPDHMENAINGTFEGTDPSHVVHMLHNAAHENGQTEFEHSHENWTGAPKLHPGHTDKGKPFWGSPPGDAQKMLDHFSASPQDGGHGISPVQVGKHLDKMGIDTSKFLDDSEFHKAYDQLHGNLHQDTGPLSPNHQHVPTSQPGVMSPLKAKKEQLKKHIQEYHGVQFTAHDPFQQHNELHDPKAFAYKGHPGHEHGDWDPHGAPISELPSGYSQPPNKNPKPGDFVSAKPWNPGHHDHPVNMSQNELANHVAMHHKGWAEGKKGEGPTPPDEGSFLDNLFGVHSDKSHSELLQEHAMLHATHESNGHTHEPGGALNPLEDQNAHYGHEPEIQTDTHPHIDNDHEALAHMIDHHPNVTQETYEDWHKSHQTGEKPSMVKLHEALHNGGTFGTGEKLPKVLDGHDHADPSGPPTQIPVGSHLVHEHGMSQDDVAKMTPAQFKAHHEQLHLKQSELDAGHGHDYPGGPMRDPRVLLPNTHHMAMRDDHKHPAVQEWYHGTGTEYEGAPKNATELQEDHGFWGNFGSGDWNNHVGSHWSSLHDMSRNFNGSGNRVIHAKLHMSNPIVYNSLNHMTHDAYERLHASGHMQDDGHFLNNHGDDNGYNACCSDRLLDYAKGKHRSDGKYGLEAYRDSLRASGYDGIHVRNQADSPEGHWNAIPLSADQIEITHGSCRGYHNDERDDDVSEFENHWRKLTRGWEHPKEYHPDQYIGTKLDHLPNEDEVNEANQNKNTVPRSNKSAEGRGDADPYYSGEHGEGNGTSHWCDHCNEDTDHDTEDCQTSKWCSVCEEHGDHETGDEHEWCEHCDDYADHDSEGCEKNPENAKVEAYCPHCDTLDLDHLHNTHCLHCNQELPDWGKLQAHGKPVKPEEYEEGGETDEAAYGHASKAVKQPGTKGFASPDELAAHLYHHHKSDVSGKAFDQGGNWNEDALKYHHQWLHQNPGEAQEKGFEVDHGHKHLFGEFKKNMTPEETHAHMMIAHAGHAGGGQTPYNLNQISAMTPEEAVEAHKKAHLADDAIQWGQKDSDKDLVPKFKHSHNLEGDQGSFDEAHYPSGDDLISHISDKAYHLAKLPDPVENALKKHPGVADALHQQMHQNFGPSAEPGVGKWHVHGPELTDEIAKKKAIHEHLKEHHGATSGYEANQLSGQSIDELMKTHELEHTSAFPKFGDADHTHMGGVTHKDPTGHTAENMKSTPTQADLIKQHLKEHHGATGKMNEPLSSLMNTHKGEHGKNPILGEPDHDHLGLSKPFPEPHHHTDETMVPKGQGDKEKIKLDSPTQNKWGEGSIVDHVSTHHPHLHGMYDDVMDTAADNGPNSPTTNSKLLEMAQAHKKFHQEHGHPSHTHYDNEPHPKEASLRPRTLTDLFEEVAS